jgi:hypothetical protein
MPMLQGKSGLNGRGSDSSWGQPCGREFVSSVSNADENEVATKADKNR